MCLCKTPTSSNKDLGRFVIYIIKYRGLIGRHLRHPLDSPLVVMVVVVVVVVIVVRVATAVVVIGLGLSD